jgi:hypothetical protein
MRSLILLALVAATPAGAQIAGSHDYGAVPRLDRLGKGDSRLPSPSVQRDVADVRDRIEDARESGRISGREARAYRRDARLIGALADRYGRDGLSPSESAELELRARILRDSVIRPASRRTGRRG